MLAEKCDANEIPRVTTESYKAVWLLPRGSPNPRELVQNKGIATAL